MSFYSQVNSVPSSSHLSPSLSPLWPEPLIIWFPAAASSCGCSFNYVFLSCFLKWPGDFTFHPHQRMAFHDPWDVIPMSYQGPVWSGTHGPRSSLSCRRLLHPGPSDVRALSSIPREAPTPVPALYLLRQTLTQLLTLPGTSVLCAEVIVPESSSPDTPSYAIPWPYFISLLLVITTHDCLVYYLAFLPSPLKSGFQKPAASSLLLHSCVSSGWNSLWQIVDTRWPLITWMCVPICWWFRNRYIISVFWLPSWLRYYACVQLIILISYMSFYPYIRLEIWI